MADYNSSYTGAQVDASVASHIANTLTGYKEATDTFTWSSGAATIDMSTCDNIVLVPTMTENSTLTVTNLTAYKPLTLPTVADTGGPWTFTLAYSTKSISLTRNGSGTADLETFEVWSDGTDLYASEGLVWTKGA